MRLCCGWLSAVLLGLSAWCAAADATADLLRKKDQALLDAIAPGDRKVWEAALANDAVYVDENGVTMDRAEFLRQLEPLPPGASGSLHIDTYSGARVGRPGNGDSHRQRRGELSRAGLEGAVPDDGDVATRRRRVEAAHGARVLRC